MPETEAPILDRKQFAEQVLGIQPGQRFSRSKFEVAYRKYRAAEFERTSGQLSGQLPASVTNAIRKGDKLVKQSQDQEDGLKALKTLKQAMDTFGSLANNESVRQLMGVPEYDPELELTPENLKRLAEVFPPFAERLMAMQPLIAQRAAQVQGKGYGDIVDAGAAPSLTEQEQPQRGLVPTPFVGRRDELRFPGEKFAPSLRPFIGTDGASAPTSVAAPTARPTAAKPVAAKTQKDDFGPATGVADGATATGPDGTRIVARGGRGRRLK